MIMLSDEFIDQLYQWTEEWYDKKKAEDPFIKRVKDSQKNFMQWWVPYQDARRIPYPDWAYDKAGDLPYELVPLT
jgi:TRAP-type mannitol/chloroaromatic compound transport system substrate-binding protein